MAGAKLIADTAYDADHLRARLNDAGIVAVIPSKELIADVAGANLIADTAPMMPIISARFRLNDAGIVAVIPSNPSRAQAIPYDAELYKERHLVECYINKINVAAHLVDPAASPDALSESAAWESPHIRATHRQPCGYMAMTCLLVGAIIWLR